MYKDGVVVAEEEQEMQGLGAGLFDDEAQDEAQDDGKDQESAEKKTWKSFTPRQKALKVILKRAGKEEFPELHQLLAGKVGTEVAIKDIGIFIGGEQSDELLSELSKMCAVRNRVNLSAEVSKKRVLEVGAQIVESGRMYQPISVARVKDDGKLECTSGRHRLVFLALVYGPEARIPVYIEEMTLNEARDAVVVSNQARPTKALERAEHIVLQSVHGNIGASQDDLYYRTVTAKAKAKRYCVFSVANRGYPLKLAFTASNDSSRKAGLTTLANVENYWGSAVAWSNGMERKEFDADLKESVRFLNAVVTAMRQSKGFDSRQHLSSMTLTAMGKYYRTYKDGTGDSPFDVAEKVAKSVVAMGEIGRQKSERTYATLVKFVPLKK